MNHVKMYGRRCEVCGCRLDPGEGRLCEDCREERERKRKAEAGRRAACKEQLVVL